METKKATIKKATDKKATGKKVTGKAKTTKTNKAAKATAEVEAPKRKSAFTLYWEEMERLNYPNRVIINDMRAILK